MNPVRISLPPYETPRKAWCAKIYSAAAEAIRAAGVAYTEKDWFEVDVHIVMTKQMLHFHDVDNRLKDILDALQARLGGPKKVRKAEPLIPNDFQILRATIEKVAGDMPGGHLTLRKLDGTHFEGAV